MLNNQSLSRGFHMIIFSGDFVRQPVLFVVFFFIYVVGFLWNVTIVTVILVDHHLHTPMYTLLCNLSCVDISYMTITLPKLMDILLSGDNYISFLHCFTQLYFYNFIAGTEMILLSVMAFDRYVAICNPLHYQLIMNKKNLLLLLCVTWTVACSNSLLFLHFASKLSFCHSNNIQHFYCDSKAINKISCPEKSFQIVYNVEALIFGPVPFLISLMSYVQIIKTILQIKSTVSRRKTFSTCASHLIVLTMFYGTVIWTYVIPTNSENSEVIDQVFSVMYSAVTPMLNPLIYSLRNKDVMNAMFQIIVKK